MSETTVTGSSSSKMWRSFACYIYCIFEKTFVQNSIRKKMFILGYVYGLFAGVSTSVEHSHNYQLKRIHMFWSKYCLN